MFKIPPLGSALPFPGPQMGTGRGAVDISKACACCLADALAVEDLTLTSSVAVGSGPYLPPAMHSGCLSAQHPGLGAPSEAGKQKLNPAELLTAGPALTFLMAADQVWE